MDLARSVPPSSPTDVISGSNDPEDAPPEEASTENSELLAPEGDSPSLPEEPNAKPLPPVNWRVGRGPSPYAPTIVGPSLVKRVVETRQLSPRRNKMRVCGPALRIAWSKVAKAAASEVPAAESEPCSDT